MSLPCPSSPIPLCSPSTQTPFSLPFYSPLPPPHPPTPSFTLLPPSSPHFCSPLPSHSFTPFKASPFPGALLTKDLKETSSACTGKGAPARVGDGGASWRLKALARAKQQASDASDPNFGRRVGDIVSEQWGSLAELTAGLTDSRAAHGM